MTTEHPHHEFIPGTRVTHRRYPQLTGTVAEHGNNTPTHVVVDWDDPTAFKGARMPECVTDLEFAKLTDAEIRRLMRECGI